MKLKFTITPYDGSPRTLVWDCKDKQEIDDMVDLLLTDTTGNTVKVSFTMYVQPQPTPKQIAQTLVDKEQLMTWYKPARNNELWDADPNCEHDEVAQQGGGVKCSKCSGWFCY